MLAKTRPSHRFESRLLLIGCILLYKLTTFLFPFYSKNEVSKQGIIKGASPLSVHQADHEMTGILGR